VSRLDDGSLIGKRACLPHASEQALGIDIDESVADSVGGLILQQLGDLPKEGQCIPFTRFDAVIKKMNGPRIVLVRIIPKVKPPR
jgi:CBS domain containing-hemolysin-like protein